MINFTESLIQLPRVIKRLLALAVDSALCAVTVALAFDLRLDTFAPWGAGHWLALAGSLCMALPLFVVLGLYRAIFRYAGLQALQTILKAATLYGSAYAFVFTVIGVQGVPRSIGVLQPVLLFIGISLTRTFIRLWLGGAYQVKLGQAKLPRVLIYGAGAAGRQLAAGIRSSAEVFLVGYLDDDPYLHGNVLNGLKVYNPAHLRQVVQQHRVTQVFLAIPSVPRAKRNQILEQIREAHVQVRTLPGLMDLAHGRIQVTDLRELDLEDLLGRDPVPPRPELIAKNITDKVVLVTGAGGSIGSELCRQIVKSGPHTLLLFELTEFALYAIHHELEPLVQDKGIRLIPLLGNVRDEARVAEIFSTWSPHTVYHAAAYKHVPLVEHNPAEGLKNNVLGTWVMAQQAVIHGADDFVLVSTDKAVRPTNVMGASKRLAEMVLQAQAAALQDHTHATRFSIVRFGNVLGSSGSVVPLFRKQIKEGGPITLTHEQITRYFMTIPEAAQLVIQAGAMAKGGDVFVLDMGAPVKIMDLATRMIELSGLTLQDAQNPHGDIALEITGLRPGEKLYEELLIGENPLPTSHSRIMKAHEDFVSLAQLQQNLHTLQLALDANDVPRLRSLLKEWVLGFQPDADVVDWVYLEKERAT